MNRTGITVANSAESMPLPPSPFSLPRPGFREIYDITRNWEQRRVLGWPYRGGAFCWRAIRGHRLTIFGRSQPEIGRLRGEPFLIYGRNGQHFSGTLAEQPGHNLEIGARFYVEPRQFGQCYKRWYGLMRRCSMNTHTPPRKHEVCNILPDSLVSNVYCGRITVNSGRNLWIRWNQILLYRRIIFWRDIDFRQRD